MKFINWKETDPEINLAFEEYVFDQMDKNDDYFLLWQNQNAVIVGKHQNTIEEINQDYVDKNKIKVVRRLSGGGAVYHDMGNLNFTFIVNENQQKLFDFKSFTAPLVKALQAIGVDAAFNSRNDIAIDGKKISGNSQYARKGRVLHHGTILFDSQLEVIQAALKVKADKVESKSIKSIRSRVTNISDYLDKPYRLDDFIKVLLDYMFKENPLEEIHLSDLDYRAIKKLRDEKYSRWEWNYGRSPLYNVRKERKCSFGLITILLQVEKGLIKDIHFYGDYFGNGNIKELESSLIGIPPKEDALLKQLEKINPSDYIDGLDEKLLVDLILL